jgi:predicted ATPase with chaperone activity
MLARAMPTILPEMSVQEALEVTRIYSVRGLLPADVPLMRDKLPKMPAAIRMPPTTSDHAPKEPSPYCRFPAIGPNRRQ